MTFTCRECKQSVSIEVSFCPHCGIPNPAATLEQQLRLPDGLDATVKRLSESDAGLWSVVTVGLVVLAIASVVVLVIVPYVRTVPPIEFSCSVGMFEQKCTFTNPAWLPASSCVRIVLVKSRQEFSDLGDSAFARGFVQGYRAVAGEEKYPVGTESRSGTVCSGLVWGRSTVSSSIGHFSIDPFELCMTTNDCVMKIFNAEVSRRISD
jgi:hypothetical protein